MAFFRTSLLPAVDVCAESDPCRFRWLAATLAAALLVAGCGPDRPSTVDVTGTVVYNGEPVDGAQVMFLSEAGRPATGTTDAQGRFRLMTFEPGDGALPGDHQVTITKKVEVDDPNQPDSPYKLARDVLPTRYASPETSGLTATVDAGGENDFRFELSD